MSEKIIELKRVSKSYKNEKAVNNVSFSVEQGHIMGLIGPNGAGKTTILKMLAGLGRADDGEILFFDTITDLDKSRKKMSFMLEEPILDPLMSAENNMRYVAYVKGLSDIEARVRKVLEIVRLNETGKKLVKHFSLGMKQRLGIGIALLNDPDVLVLDEPMNGLDPEGLVEIRNLLKELAEKKNVTILISSHMLSELSELCTDYVIISGGRLVETASMNELMEKSKQHITIRTNDTEKTIALLKRRFAITKYKEFGNGELILYEFPEQIDGIFRAMIEEGLAVNKFSYEAESLEQYYLSKVGGINE